MRVVNARRLGASIASTSLQDLVSSPAGTCAQPQENATAPHGDAFERVGVFVRTYSLGGRPYIPFHCDSARYTINVALNADAEFEGGRLLVLHAGKVRSVERTMGEAVAHPSTLMHGVSAMSAGVRHSLIVFFH